MKLSWKHEGPLLAIIVAMFVAAACSWNLVPERLPVHWNAAGKADGWGGRVSGILLLPIITLLVSFLMVILPRFDPGRANFDKFAGPYFIFRLALVLFMAGLYAAMHAAFRGIQLNMTLVILPLMGMLFVVIGWLMTHVQPNWSVGIRTPWTMSSRLSWDRSHRLGSRLFMLIGILAVVAGFVGKAWAIGVAVGAMLLVAVIIVVYSYLVWKGDPDRRPSV